jgi:hypothetical protein
MHVGKACPFKLLNFGTDGGCLVSGKMAASSLNRLQIWPRH